MVLIHITMDRILSHMTRSFTLWPEIWIIYLCFLGLRLLDFEDPFLLLILVVKDSLFPILFWKAGSYQSGRYSSLVADQGKELKFVEDKSKVVFSALFFVKNGFSCDISSICSGHVDLPEVELGPFSEANSSYFWGNSRTYEANLVFWGNAGLFRGKFRLFLR